MKPGDIYPHHIRGSIYCFKIDQIYHKDSNRNKFYAQGDIDEIIKSLKDVRGDVSGRFRINEEQEITTYKKEENRWIPYYVGKFTNDFSFDDYNNNPNFLEPGQLWTGFINKHGSKFHLDLKARVYFRESISTSDFSEKRNYFVKNIDDDFLDLLLSYKKDAGSFRINEYGHVSAPITQTVLDELYDEGLTERAKIQEGWEKLSKKQKLCIQRYSEPSYNKYTKKDEKWYPIYIGKYTNKLEIGRKEEPKILFADPDDYDV